MCSSAIDHTTSDDIQAKEKPQQKDQLTAVFFSHL